MAMRLQSEFVKNQMLLEKCPKIGQHFEFCQFVKFLDFMDFMRRIAKNTEKLCKRHQITARIYYRLLTLFQFRL